jgi:hypothetical protein
MPAPQNTTDKHDSHVVAQVLLGIVITVWLSIGLLVMCFERMSR